MNLSRVFGLFRKRRENPVSKVPNDPALDADMQANIQRLQEKMRAIPDDAGHEDEFCEDPCIPIGTWIRLREPDFPAFVGFTYVDTGAGFSVRGGAQNEPDLGEQRWMTYRLPFPRSAWRRLSADEIQRLDLPDEPSWLEAYGPQPPPGTRWASWRNHPQLQGRFHPECPDDLQVVIHDGGPRLSKHRPERVWVRVVGGDDDVWMGHVLNEPCHLTSVSRGDLISFVVPEGSEHALLVTGKYLRERPDWIIQACRGCGLSELYDAPSDLTRRVFPDVPEGVTMSIFTAICPACGGTQVVQHKDFDLDAARLAELQPREA